MVETVAILAFIILLGLSFFQVLLISGAPYGKYAWGGTHTILPNKLRLASVLSIFLYSLFAYSILGTAGVVFENSSQWIGIFMWIFTAYFFVGVIMNGISKSKSERAVMTPTAIALTVCFLYVAVS